MLRPASLVQAHPPRHGPKALYAGQKCPAEESDLQTLIPTDHHSLIGVRAITTLKARCWLQALVWRSWWRTALGVGPPPIAAPTSARRQWRPPAPGPPESVEVNQP